MIYLHLVDSYGKCRFKKHTWMVWAAARLQAHILLNVTCRVSRVFVFCRWRLCATVVERGGRRNTKFKQLRSQPHNPKRSGRSSAQPQNVVLLERRKVPPIESMIVFNASEKNISENWLISPNRCTKNIYTWNPNDPCFDWKGPCFGGLTFKSRGHWGSRYLYEITPYLGWSLHESL